MMGEAILDRHRVALVLFNLGRPHSKESIEPFLKNFFTDPNIIRLPGPLRSFIAGRIAAKRSRKEAGFSYGELGDKSPLLENTRAQATLLQDALNKYAASQKEVRTLQGRLAQCGRSTAPEQRK